MGENGCSEFHLICEYLCFGRMLKGWRDNLGKEVKEGFFGWFYFSVSGKAEHVLKKQVTQKINIRENENGCLCRISADSNPRAAYLARFLKS